MYNRDSDYKKFVHHLADNNDGFKYYNTIKVTSGIEDAELNGNSNTKKYVQLNFMQLESELDFSYERESEMALCSLYYYESGYKKHVHYLMGSYSKCYGLIMAGYQTSSLKNAETNEMKREAQPNNSSSEKEKRELASWGGVTLINDE